MLMFVLYINIYF